MEPKTLTLQDYVKLVLDPEFKKDYFEWEGYLVSRPAADTGLGGTSIFQNGKWRSIELDNGDTSLFPLTKEEAAKIVLNGFPKFSD